MAGMQRRTTRRARTGGGDSCHGHGPDRMSGLPGLLWPGHHIQLCGYTPAPRSFLSAHRASADLRCTPALCRPPSPPGARQSTALNEIRCGDVRRTQPDQNRHRLVPPRTHSQRLAFTLDDHAVDRHIRGPGMRSARNGTVSVGRGTRDVVRLRALACAALGVVAGWTMAAMRRTWFIHLFPPVRVGVGTALRRRGPGVGQCHVSGNRGEVAEVGPCLLLHGAR